MSTFTTTSHTCHICHKPAEKKCARCKVVWYCTAECQKEDWKSHKSSCKKPETTPSAVESSEVLCVKIHSPHTRYENVKLPPTHEIFNSDPLPITTKFGYPLVMARLVEGLPREPGTNCQHATWLNIDPQTGFAPPKWQGGVGSVIVAAADKSPLDTDKLGAIVDYVSGIFDDFGDGDVPRRKYDRKVLDKYLQRRKEGYF